MQLSYKLTLGDWKAALRLHARQRIGRRIHYFIYDFVVPSFAIVGITFLLWAQRSGDTEAVDELRLVGIGLVVIAIISPIVRERAIRRSFRGLLPLSPSGPGYSLDINEERILSTRPGFGEATYYWSGICGVTRNEKIIILYLSEILFLGIPVHALTPEQQIELDNLISQHVSKGKQ